MLSGTTVIHKYKGEKRRPTTRCFVFLCNAGGLPAPNSLWRVPISTSRVVNSPSSQAYGALKRSAKEAKGGAKLSPVEAAVLGSGASLVAQAVTTPLDVVRTRVMSAPSGDRSYEGVGRSEAVDTRLLGPTAIRLPAIFNCFCFADGFTRVHTRWFLGE